MGDGRGKGQGPGSGILSSGDEGIIVGLVNRVGEGPLQEGDIHFFDGTPVWFPGSLSQISESWGSVCGSSRDTTQDPLDEGACLHQGSKEGSQGMEGCLPDSEPTQRAGEGGL